MMIAEPAEADPFELCGSTLGDKYRVDRLVGSGGFGVVYRGTHQGFDEPIAIKCLRVAEDLEQSERATLLKQLRDEGAVLHRLSKRCAGIVQALDADAAVTPSGHWVPYLVLEWLEGETLSSYLDRQLQAGEPLSLAEAAGLLAPAFDALAQAHRRKVAHRDVKPDNLFLERGEGTVTLKVLDFGIAKVLSGHASFTASPAATRERPTAFTPLYGAPEQFNKRLGASGPWTDVFALALILVEMVTGKRALEGDNPTQLYVAATNPAARPTMRYHGIDPGDAVEAVLDRALAIEPHDRLQDAGVFWDELQTALTGERPVSSAPMAATGDYLRLLALSGVGVSAMGSAVSSGVITPMSLAETQEAVTLSGADGAGALSSGALSSAELASGALASGELAADRASFSSSGGAAAPLAVAARRGAGFRGTVLRWLHIRPEIAPRIPPEARKSVPFGIGVAALVPFLGLLYAAPFWSSLLVTLGIGILVGVLESLPYIGAALGYITPLIWVAVNGVLGGTYTWHYNRHGKRTPLRAVDYDAEVSSAPALPVSSGPSH